MTDTNVEEKTPEWLLRLESRKRKPRLAHEIGAGAPCLSCGDGCPGLDLHFWRKLCRNCKCKKEEHDVKDDDGYEQFEILLGGKKKQLGGVLKFKVPEAEKSVDVGKPSAHAGTVSFDWVPPDVPEDVATEYMRQIPVGKLPITGSDGAVYRRQQLEKQVPLHDLDASRCHNLSAEEVEGLMQYLNNLKNNAVGQGKVTKVPVLYREHVLHSAVPFQSCGSEPATVASAATASGLQPSHPVHLRSLPPSFNAAPRPFHPSSASDPDFPPPPPLEVETAVPNSSVPNLKMPSAFVPQWKPSEVTPAIIPYGQGYDVVHGVEPANWSQLSHAINHPVGQDIHSNQGKMPSTQFSHGPVPHTGDVSSSTYPYQVQHSSEVPGRAEPLFSQKAVGKAAAKTTPEAHSQQSIIVASKFPSGLATSEMNRTQYPNLPRPFPGNNFQATCPNNKISVHPDISNHNVGTSPPTATINNFDPSGYPLNHGFLGAIDEEGNPILPGEHSKDSDVPASHRVVRDVHRFPQDVVQSERVAASAFPQHLACSCVIPASSDPDEVLYLDPKCALHHLPDRGTGVGAPGYPGPDVQPVGYQSQMGPPRAVIPGNPSEELSTGSGKVGRGVGGVAQAPVGCTTFPEATLSESVGAPYGVEVAHSTTVGSDGMPKSARVMHNSGPADKALAEQLARMSGLGAGGPPVAMDQLLTCQECKEGIRSGDVAVFAERAGSAPWHPPCFVCHTCKELLVDLMYFYHKGYIYCGRHYADLLQIPRCFACDELIFVKEYTMAEGKAFHVKHFCCYECDVPLGGMKYILKDEQPVCLDCYQDKYGKRCHTCGKMIAAGDQRVTLKELNWHATPGCFRCHQCEKSLLGGKMVVKQERPFCSKECVQLGLSS